MMTLEIRAVQVPMTPDKKIMWEQHEIQSSGAVILRSVGCDEKIIDALVRASQYPIRYRTERIKAGAVLGSGAFGDVYRQQADGIDLALKLFHYKVAHGTERHQGLSGLRANVAVAEGLRRLTANEKHIFTTRLPQSTNDMRFALKTPTYFAAVLYPKSTSSCDTWAMSFERGSDVPRLQYQPPYDEYRTVLNRACRRVGLKPKQIEYDCGLSNKNVLLRHSDDIGIHADLVKIDSYARVPLTF